MCTYNITLNDQLVEQARSSFASEKALTVWLQQQVEALLTEYNTKQRSVVAKARMAIEAMRRQSEQNGNANLTLDEINKEIRQTRRTKVAL